MSTRFISAEGLNGTAEVVLPDGGRPYDYEVHSIYVEYVSKGPPAGARQIRIEAVNPLGHTVTITGGDTQPVNTTRHYMVFSDAVLERVPNGDDIQWCPWPPTAVYEGGMRIRVRNAAQVTPLDEVRLRVQYDTTRTSRGEGV